MLTQPLDAFHHCVRDDDRQVPLEPHMEDVLSWRLEHVSPPGGLHGGPKEHRGPIRGLLGSSREALKPLQTLGKLVLGNVGVNGPESSKLHLPLAKGFALVLKLGMLDRVNKVFGDHRFGMSLGTALTGTGHVWDAVDHPRVGAQRGALRTVRDLGL
jgi:hypothetical protein